MTEEVEIEGKAVIGFRLIINERIRAYQLQIKGSGNYKITDLERWISLGKTQSLDHVPLYMGAVVNILHWRDIVAKISALERQGYRAVGLGAKIFPNIVLDTYSEKLENMR